MYYYNHEMPFGAQVNSDASVTFNLWAPGALTINLKLFDAAGEIVMPMEKRDDGWFSLVTTKAIAGTLYMYERDGGQVFPDPASRYQPEGIHGPSQVVDPRSYQWNDASWRGRPWNEMSIYELHVGTFNDGGRYGGVQNKLDYLQKLGVTAIELMPIAQGPGTRSWGYDGAYLYAPETTFGLPNDLKLFIETAHQRGLMVFLDVVYNHFGPEGNYLGQYAPEFFTDKHKTPWGQAINFDQEGSAAVREFYYHNALYWLEEYRFDGLRCDAVHAIVDDSPVHIFEEIAMRVSELARREDRHIHIIAENENNVAHLLERDQNNRPKRFTAQWNDDFHHNLHVILTGESDAFFVDYASRPYELLARCLTEGYAYQGEASEFRGGKTRGEDSKAIRLDAFINFLQNHDQAGNRPMGDRLITLTSPEKLRAAVAVMILNPAPPMLFMGEEWGSTQPFPFFCDFGPELSKIIRESRIKEFAIGDKFKDEMAIAAIPDPTSEMTYESVKLDWSVIDNEPHRSWLSYYRTLLALRSIEIIPLIDRISSSVGASFVDGTLIVVRWPLDDGTYLIMEANLGDQIKTRAPELSGAGRRIIFTTHLDTVWGDYMPWSVIVSVGKVADATGVQA